MDFGYQELMDAIFLRYSIENSDPPHRHDSCGDGFSVTCVLEFKNGGIVTSCHNELCNEVEDLSRNALTPTTVSDYYLINPGRTVRSRNYVLSGFQKPQ